MRDLLFSTQGVSLLQEPLQAKNPFATRCIRPAAQPYLFPQGVTIGPLVDCLRTNRWRGEIVGPHGSGKSTLINSMLPALELCGQRIYACQLHGNGNRSARTVRLPDPIPANAQLIVDGFEQLGRLRRFHLRWKTLRRGVGLLVTSHHSAGLPRIWTTSTSQQLAEQIVERLLWGYSQTPIRSRHIRSAFERHAGNIREMLMDLYDVYEANDRNGLQNRHTLNR